MRLNETISHLSLADIHIRKPLLDGKKICELYQIKTGKIVGNLVNELFTYSILYPDASQKDAHTYMLENKDKFLAKYN